ncbi:TIR domain-containing protein [Labrys okinawensis]|uniref:TIR domain-containing protein n=1 Tax=Labrys okinawensis TaxID=346911 RepID=UPI0039BC6947
MVHNFANLSATDFEELSRDLIGRALGVRFEGFTPGPDGGIDGRHAIGPTATILQAKHFGASSFASLKRTMIKERTSIDRLAPQRYILATSQGLTPPNKAALKGIIGPSLRDEADIFGIDDLSGLLREYPDLLKAHPKLWMVSGGPLQEIVTSAVAAGIERTREVPRPLVELLQPTHAIKSDLGAENPAANRDVLFVAKTRQDDEFALWLAPKLEAEGYNIFADILTLEPGDRWRKERSQALRNRAIKILLLCRDTSLTTSEIQDDISMGGELAEELGDKRFIIPLRLEPYKKVHGIGDAIHIDFVRGWAEGFQGLLDTLKRQGVPKRAGDPQIHPNWETFRRRSAIPLQDEPERLTSNWLRVSEVPDQIFYYEPVGHIDRDLLARALSKFPRPVSVQGAGFFSFADGHEVDAALANHGRFKVKHAVRLDDFLDNGLAALGVEPQTASNILYVLFRVAWTAHCTQRGFIKRQYSNAAGFHVSQDQAAIAQRIPYGKQGERRWSMLRNVAKAVIWSFGVTAIPVFQPFFHFRLKSRVLFATPEATKGEEVIDDARKQHRLRRTICKGWRNKQWRGRLLAFLEILSEDSAFVTLPVSDSGSIILDAWPMLFTSPVSTSLPDELRDDEEEVDASTLGRPEPDEVEP